MCLWLALSERIFRFLLVTNRSEHRDLKIKLSNILLIIFTQHYNDKKCHIWNFFDNSDDMNILKRPRETAKLVRSVWRQFT